MQIIEEAYGRKFTATTETIMATYNIYLDTRRMKKDGTFPVKINVRHRGQFMLSTNFNASPDAWAGTEYSRKEPNHRARNAALRLLLGRLEETLVTLDRAGTLRQMTDAQLKEHLKRELFGTAPKARPFTDFIGEFISRKQNAGTRSVYEGTRRKLMQFDPQCTFETMDRRWLERFEQWMRDGGMKTNALAIHLRNVRAVFNYAIDEEHTTLYPFRRFSIKKEETRKRSLSVEHLRTLRDYPCEPYQRKYVDMFMLMFYLIGINAADLFLARKSDVVDGRLEYKRAKTGKLYSIKIEPEAQAIIDRHAGKGEYLLDVMDGYANYKDFLHRMGIGLKRIGTMERKGRGGKKVIAPLFPDISSYWTRHTWATIAASLDIPKETISEALGHSIGSPVTSIYIDFDRRKVDEANRRVIDRVNGGL